MIQAAFVALMVSCSDGDETTPPPSSEPSQGECCSGGDCLCHGPAPIGFTSAQGPYRTASFNTSVGTVYHPTNATAPFAGVALSGGFLNAGWEMSSWGTFYASHGIVTIIVNTGVLALVLERGLAQLDGIAELKKQNSNAGSPLYQKMSGRYGTSGYSMGGGGTTRASGLDPTLKTSVGLAAWDPAGPGLQVPTLFLCGDADIVAPCGMSQGAYRDMPGTTPKMGVIIPGATHFSWFGPKDAAAGMSGGYALAFQKVFLEGDERWRSVLIQGGGGEVARANIQ
jgi:pimeloyl-ACP methyl ester carboxylesterase